MFVEKRHPLPKGVVFKILKIEYPLVWNLKFKYALSPCGDLSISIWNFQLWLPNRSCYTTGGTKLQLDPKTENTGGRLFETTQMIKSLGKKAKQGMNIEHDEGVGLNFLGKKVFSQHHWSYHHTKTVIVLPMSTMPIMNQCRRFPDPLLPYSSSQEWCLPLCPGLVTMFDNTTKTRGKQQHDKDVQWQQW